MKGWTMPIQRASFNGVRFNVLSVDDSLERAVVEHSYPFVNGADLESMGLAPLTVSMSAVFYGDGYYTDFKKFIEKLKINKPSVLVHPIRGRLKNMICTSATFSHEADFIDYVSLQLTFKEATPAQPIFIFKNSLLNKIDEILNKIDDFIDDVMELFGEVMGFVSFALNAYSRILGAWNAIYGIYEQVLDVFDSVKSMFDLSSSVSKETFKKQSTEAVKHISKVLNDNLTFKDDKSGVFSAKSKMDDVLRTINKISEIPTNLVTEKDKKPKPGDESLQKLYSSCLTRDDIKEIDCAIRLLLAAYLTKFAVEFIESRSDSLTPSEIDYFGTKIRLYLLDTLNLIRKLQREEQINNLMNTGLYSQYQQVAEGIRNLSHYFTQLCIAAINKKPPLIIRSVKSSGTIVQVAHEFYGDYRRFEELLLLNPQLGHPNFIQQGEALNSYAE